MAKALGHLYLCRPRVTYGARVNIAGRTVESRYFGMENSCGARVNIAGRTLESRYSGMENCTTTCASNKQKNDFYLFRAWTRCIIGACIARKEPTAPTAPHLGSTRSNADHAGVTATAATAAAAVSQELWDSEQAHLPTHAGTKYPARGITTPHSD